MAFELDSRLLAQYGNPQTQSVFKDSGGSFVKGVSSGMALGNQYKAGKRAGELHNISLETAARNKEKDDYAITRRSVTEAEDERKVEAARLEAIRKETQVETDRVAAVNVIEDQAMEEKRHSIALEVAGRASEKAIADKEAARLEVLKKAAEAEQQILKNGYDKATAEASAATATRAAAQELHDEETRPLAIDKLNQEIATSKAAQKKNKASQRNYNSEVVTEKFKEVSTQKTMVLLDEMRKNPDQAAQLADDAFNSGLLTGPDGELVRAGLKNTGDPQADLVNFAVGTKYAAHMLSIGNVSAAKTWAAENSDGVKVDDIVSVELEKEGGNLEDNTIVIRTTPPPGYTGPLEEGLMVEKLVLKDVLPDAGAGSVASMQALQQQRTNEDTLRRAELNRATKLAIKDYEQTQKEWDAYTSLQAKPVNEEDLLQATSAIKTYDKDWYDGLKDADVQTTMAGNIERDRRVLAKMNWSTEQSWRRAIFASKMSTSEEVSQIRAYLSMTPNMVIKDTKEGGAVPDLVKPGLPSDSITESTKSILNKESEQSVGDVWTIYDNNTGKPIEVTRNDEGKIVRTGN